MTSEPVDGYCPGCLEEGLRFKMIPCKLCGYLHCEEQLLAYDKVCPTCRHNSSEKPK